MMKPSFLFLPLLILVWFFGACAPMKPVPLIPFIDGEHWMVASPLIYERASTGEVYEVPEGFVTDFASIPRPLWPIYPKTGRYQLAAVVHDFLYWEQTTTRKEADEIFLAGMIESDVPKKDRTVIYQAVRTGGGRAWKKNAEERAAGKPRQIPSEYRDIPANTEWKEYREFLYKEGVRP
ncbi:DUF1353 domain-containing protein [Roseibacillus ishigakijimensis]|uniref:DUF1353 domain-containing protein n=1 Tax=Roseibacillus ishigakijimensis TaxID=454146 RepID=A0A934VL12_9BACT|nr:DUF1353 domain-containing protein [Roseibacillus ishigakijimensis]MBK1832742.1 DUF1353 domain-containing protein [Roseibacillus ishigakijimensis]